MPSSPKSLKQKFQFCFKSQFKHFEIWLGVPSKSMNSSGMLMLSNSERRHLDLEGLKMEKTEVTFKVKRLFTQFMSNCDANLWERKEKEDFS